MAAVRVGHELLARRRGSLGKARIEQARHLVGLRPRPKTEFWVNVTDEVVSRLGYRTSPTTHPHARDATQAESTLVTQLFRSGKTRTPTSRLIVVPAVSVLPAAHGATLRQTN